jgi:uncharacterized heparinase superfamily protein
MMIASRQAEASRAADDQGNAVQSLGRAAIGPTRPAPPEPDGDPRVRDRLRAFLRLPRELAWHRLAYAAKRPFFAFTLPGLSVFGAAPAAVKLNPPDPWPGNAALGSAIIQGSFTFAGKTLDHPAPLWDALGAEPDWCGALHGFAWLRDLRAAGGDAARRTARELVVSWIEHNRRWRRPAWEPVVIGSRLTNWLSQYEFFAASADLELRQLLLTSATRQATHLYRMLPAGLAGADVIAAAKGLIYAGTCLPGGQAWRERGLALLSRELPRQILADGGHVERSPARHFAVLRDLIDLRATLHAAEIEAPAHLHSAIESMAALLRLLQHGDGALALFNDSNEDEGWQLDMVLQRCGGRNRPIMSAPQSGFQRLQAGRSLVIVDAGAPPAAGFDAHSHAGTLSFEMSDGRDRLIVNCGAHASRDEWHRAQRTTAAHSTLTLHTTNSSEVMPAGGLGRRPRNVTCRRQEDDGSLWLEMSHDGYLENLGVIHHRRLYLAAGGEDLRGEDRIQARRAGAGLDYVVRFHLHPDVQASLAQAGDAVFLRGPKGSGWRLRTAGAALSLEPSVYLGRPGEMRRTLQVVLSGTTKGSGMKIKWSLQREGRNRK